jgi:transposase
MMGKRDPQKQLWNYQMNLDKRVRSDHPLRRVHETLELDFVRREVPKFYGTKGNVSEDQVVITKLMLLNYSLHRSRQTFGRVSGGLPSPTDWC